MPAKLPVLAALPMVSALSVASPLVAQEASVLAEAAEPQGGQPISVALLMQSVPSAIGVLDAQTLRATDIFDLKGVERLSSSLLTLSGPSEATGTVLRVRGVGTASPNPGLLPSVDVRVDGVYRGRAGTAMGDLGTLERIDVRRGPEEGVAGRSATSGLVDIFTPAPDFSSVGRWNISKGSMGGWRIGGDVTSSVKDDRAAMRFDGWWETRDGQLSDPATGEALNDRARYLLRGQLLWLPAANVSVRLIGDYSRRRDSCCAAVYLPFDEAVAPVVAAMRAEGAILADDPAGREVSVTPGRGFSSAQEDWGLSAEVRWQAGPGTLTSLTAWRSWQAREGQDTDGNNLDLLARNERIADTGTFSQDLRYEGRWGPLDWMVGGDVSREALVSRDDLAFGSDYTAHADALVRLSDPAFAGYAALADSLGLPGETLDGRGIVEDRWRQTQTRSSLFTHNILSLGEQFALTLGARYNRATTALDASLAGNNALCGRIAADATLASLQPLACAIPGFSAEPEARRSDDAMTGNATLAWKPADGLLLFAGYRTGWKPGAFTLDRTALDPASLDPEALGLAPERSASVEAGAKLTLGEAWFNLTFFSSKFQDYQYAGFDGSRIIASTLAACRDPLVDGACAPDRLRASVTSRGLEAETSFRPVPDLRFDLGFTYAEARFREELVGAGGVPLDPSLVPLAGERLPAAPEFVHTGRLFWTPAIGSTPLRMLWNLDWRFSSSYRTAPNLAPGATFPDLAVLNARAGVIGPDGRWSVELWAQNLTNALLLPVAEPAPLQGVGSSSLLLAWPQMPRTYGFALRTRF